jgi:hypothetical protein
MPFDPPYQPDPAVFPALSASGFSQTSPRDRRYNCIAWAVGQKESRSFWWPGPPLDGKWPAGVPRNDSIAAFQMAFTPEGYHPCSDGSLETGYDKIALYALDGHVKHAARQLSTGEWTSKLGRDADITHSLDALNSFGTYGYGTVVAFMKRQVSPGLANYLNHIPSTRT